MKGGKVNRKPTISRTKAARLTLAIATVPYARKGTPRTSVPAVRASRRPGLGQDVRNRGGSEPRQAMPSPFRRLEVHGGNIRPSISSQNYEKSPRFRREYLFRLSLGARNSRIFWDSFGWASGLCSEPNLRLQLLSVRPALEDRFCATCSSGLQDSLPSESRAAIGP